MKRRFFQIGKFQTKVTLTIIASTLLVMGASDLLVQRMTLHAQFESLREKLMLIAQTAAMAIDPQTLSQVPLNKPGVTTSQYQSIAQQLKKIRSFDSDIKYIYTMTKTREDGVWRFIVDLDPLAQHGNRIVSTAFPGDEYNASRFPEMLKSFDGPSADTKFEYDEWGATLSGYAPIRNKEGKAIAIVGVDMLADDVFVIQKNIKRQMLLVALMGVILAIILGMIIAQRITRPVHELVEGTAHLAKGNMHYRVKVYGNDELGELAKHFNHMAKQLGHSQDRLLSYFFDTVKSLVHILEVRDHYTRGHSESVARYAVKIAYRMGFPKVKIDMFENIALLHDIGKIGIKDSILHKKEKLTDEEWESIKQHPTMGEEILKHILPQEPMLAAVRGHHERFDGTGYPDGLTGEQIDIFTAILAVADAYDAMTSNRAYRSSLTQEQAIAELKKNKGIQFHPQVVDVFLQILGEEQAV